MNAAAKISHRAQTIGSLASQWHALRTCTPTDISQLRLSSSTGNLELNSSIGSLCINYSESDLESLDFVPTSQSTPLASYTSSYHKRQALGMRIKSWFRLFLVLLFSEMSRVTKPADLLLKILYTLVKSVSSFFWLSCTFLTL